MKDAYKKGETSFLFTLLLSLKKKFSSATYSTCTCCSVVISKERMDRLISHYLANE